jgi:putrescine transport system ATP-binding protein
MAVPASMVPAGAKHPQRQDRLGDEHYVRIEALRKTYDDVVAVDDVSFSIRKGEIFALLGASGCGKSTLLRCLAGFERASAGRIVIDGEEMAGLAPYERPTNMVFQSYALFPHMTVAQNIGYGLRQEKWSKDHIQRRVEEMLALVQMEKYARRKPHQLSGGQQQRVALARSLAKSPKLLLLDEPMGALDKKLRSQMQLELVNIIERLGVTCVMVTHDQEEAMTMADRICLMDAGRTCQIGTPDEIYEQPGSRFVADFIGSVNLLEGKVEQDEKDFITIRSPALDGLIRVGHGITGFEGMDVALAVRPEKLRIAKEAPAQPYNKTPGTIENIAYFGNHSVYHVRLDSGFRFLVNAINDRRWASEAFTWDDRVWISWEDNAGVVLTT